MLEADLRDDKCPHGNPPKRTMLASGEWLINGKPREKEDKCQIITFNIDACESCELNPLNRPAPSARLAWLFRVQSWQTAGAVFRFNDLRSEDWDGLAIVIEEMRRAENERIKRK